MHDWIHATPTPERLPARGLARYFPGQGRARRAGFYIEVKRRRLRDDLPKNEAVRVEIEKMLGSGLPEKYTSELFETKCGALFQHVLEKYPEVGESVYGEAVG